MLNTFMRILFSIGKQNICNKTITNKAFLYQICSEQILLSRKLRVSPVRTMFIQVQETPNPLTLKFLPGRKILEAGRTYEFTTAEHTRKSQLARQLMRIDGVKGVFFGEDFITVMKTSEDEEWSLIKPHVFATIMDYIQSGKPILADESIGADSPTDTTILPDDDEVVATIKELLETRIKPMVQEDGGDVLYAGFDDGILKLRLQGSCTGCPSSVVTLKSGIKNMMQFYVPEVKDVVEIPNDEENTGEIKGQKKETSEQNSGEEEESEKVDLNQFRLKPPPNSVQKQNDQNSQ